MLILITVQELELSFSEPYWERLDPAALLRLCYPLATAFGPFSGPAIDRWNDRPRRLCDLPIPEIVHEAWRGNLTIDGTDDPRVFKVRATPVLGRHAAVLGERGTIVELLDLVGAPAVGTPVQHVVAWPQDESELELGAIAAAGYSAIKALSGEQIWAQTLTRRE